MQRTSNEHRIENRILCFRRRLNTLVIWIGLKQRENIFSFRIFTFQTLKTPKRYQAPFSDELSPKETLFPGKLPLAWHLVFSASHCLSNIVIFTDNIASCVFTPVIVPRLFEEKRRDMVFGFPSFRPSVCPSEPTRRYLGGCALCGKNH